MMLAQTSASDSGTSPSVRTEKKGRTIGEALAFIKTAKRVYVAVPTGFNGGWDYFTVSKSQAAKHLKWLGARATEPLFYSKRVESSFDGEAEVYLGSPHDRAPRASTPIPGSIER